MTSQEIEKELVLVEIPAEKHWRGRVEGTTFTQTSWAEGRKPRVTSKELPTHHSAKVAFEKACRKKFCEGYAFRRPLAGAEPGQTILEVYAPGGGGGPVLDISPDGGRVIGASVGRQAYGYTLMLFDVATGACKIVAEELASPRQTFLHAALFDHTGQVVYFQLNEDTWRLDLPALERRKIAGYNERRTAMFNPFVVRPSFDSARRHLVVYDTGSTVRVLGADGRSLLEVSTASRTTECRAGGISPSGRLLGLYRVSRGLVYGHANATHDTTNEVEVWDIDRRERVTTLRFTDQVAQVGFSPDDRELVVRHGFAHGPAGYSLATGERLWQFDSPHGNGQLAICYDLACSPDGKVLAVGGDGLRLYQARTREPIPQGEGWLKVERVAFSGDGRLLAHSLGGLIVVRKV